MPLDRESIERKDFPVGRRGYDQAAVDAHLAALAAEVEELRRRTSPRPETVAGRASEQVRAILEAAEQAAAEMRRRAEADVGALREEATGDARDYVAEVSQGSQAMVGRIEAIERDLADLFQALRAGAERVGADLRTLEAGVAALRRVAEPAPVAEPDARPRRGDGRDVADAPEVPAPTPVSTGAPTEGGDGEGARLVALDMALNGSSREETGRYLAEHYALADPDALLDEVYATVGS